MTNKNLLKYGKRLLDLGYPIIPIRQGMKHPGMKGWQDLVADTKLLDNWLNGSYNNNSGVGVLTSTVKAVDIDVRDSSVVDQLVAFIDKRFPSLVHRIGNAPKVALIYRSEAPFRKITSRKYVDLFGDDHKVEILGSGQQFVAYHIHPDTNQPYTYPKQELADTSYEDLPVLTEEDARDIVLHFETLAEEAGWVTESEGQDSNTSAASSGDAVMNAQPPIGLSHDEIERCLDLLDPNMSHDEWVRVGMGLYHETNGSQDGFALWDEWSSPGDTYNEKEMRTRWDSFQANLNNTRPTTFATVYAWAREQHQQKKVEKQLDGFAFTPVSALKPVNKIPPREWLYGTHLIRKYVSVTVAPGGVGKSRLLMAEAISMASGRSLLGPKVPHKLKVAMWNLEDDIDELSRVYHANLIHHKLNTADVSTNLFIDSGRDKELCTAVIERGGFKLLEPVYDKIVQTLVHQEVDVLIIDPFVSSHRVPENDNGMIDAVVKKWAWVADRANCAIELVHHTRKASGAEGVTADSARGGSAIVGAARDVRVLNRMTEDEATLVGVSTFKCRRYFKVSSDKSNFAPADQAEWYEINSVELMNDPENLGGDSVGVVAAWTPPDPVKDVSDELKAEALVEIGNGNFSTSTRKKDWAGYVVARVLDIALEGGPGSGRMCAGKHRARKILEAWTGDELLAQDEVREGSSAKYQAVFVLTEKGAIWAEENGSGGFDI